MATYNECRLAYYQANGATSDDLQDAEREWLIAQAIPPAHNQDMFFQYLRAQLYTGSLDDMRDQFWIDQGCQPD